MTNRLTWLGTGAVLAALVIGCSTATPKPAASQTPAGPPMAFTFALIGDLGYVPEEEPWVDNVWADLNGHSSLAFVVHVGDITAG